MANIKTWLEAVETKYGEPIEAIVVGVHDERWGEKANESEGVILDRDTGLQKLDEEYDNGFGGADCYPCYAWTASRIFLIHEYDGSTGLVWLPRNPVDVLPEFGGETP